MLGRLILHTSNYTIGNLLVMLASVISFPIFTRTFSTSEYGALSMISAVLLFWTAIGKLGVQNSIIRFHAEVCADKNSIGEASYLSTVLTGMTIAGAVAAAGCAIMSLVVPAAWWHNEHVARLMLPVSVLILARVADSAVTNTLRAQQRSALFSIYAVARKYLGLAVTLLIIFYAVPQLNGFYLGTIVTEVGAVLLLGTWLVRANQISLGKVSWTTYKGMVVFGVPLIVFELSGIVLNLGDRYVIQAMMGSESLGHYSAAYNLCDYLQTVLFASISQAVTPMYTRLWEEKGEESTRYFVARSLRLYILFTVPILFGMTALSRELLTVLASAKYAEGAVAIPYVVAGMLVSGAMPIFGAGIYIHKQNRQLIPFMVGIAALNILLNILLIPFLGLVAAGLATAICYVLLGAAAWKLGSKQLMVKFPAFDICKFMALSMAMYAIILQVKAPIPLLQLVLRSVTGVVVYGVLVLIFDKQSRELLARIRRRIWGQNGTSH